VGGMNAATRAGLEGWEARQQWAAQSTRVMVRRSAEIAASRPVDVIPAASSDNPHGGVSFGVRGEPDRRRTRTPRPRKVRRHR